MLGRPQKVSPAHQRGIDVELQIAPQLIAFDHAAVVNQCPAWMIAAQPDAYSPTFRRCAAQPDDKLDPRAIDVRRPAQLGNGDARYGLKPDRLPDPCRAMIPDVAGTLAPILLPARLLEVVRLILRPDYDDLRTSLDEKRRDICAERRMSAFMLDRESAVDPHGRLVVHGPEMKSQGVGTERIIQGEFTPVPHHWVKTRVLDTGQFALRRERDENCSTEDVGPLKPAVGKAAVLIVEREAPITG